MFMLLLACSHPMAVADSPDTDLPPMVEWAPDTGPTTAWATFLNAADTHLWPAPWNDAAWTVGAVGIDPGESRSIELDPGVWTFVLHDDAENC